MEGDNGATMFFIVEKHQKTILNFSLDSLSQNNINNVTLKNIKLIEWSKRFILNLRQDNRTLSMIIQGQIIT